MVPFLGCRIKEGAPGLSGRTSPEKAEVLVLSPAPCSPREPGWSWAPPRLPSRGCSRRSPLQVFFVIHLHAGPVINTLPPIVDPDPLLSCDLMDGRDAFLTLARDKHWEFSSLRRSKWSTLCMLVELHTQGQDRFVYTCNECKHHVETRWHCTVCEVGPAPPPPLCTSAACRELLGGG